MTTETMRNVAAVRVLSPMQAGMLYHSLLDPGSGVFIQQMAFSVEQDLDAAAMRRVWSRLVDRHDALRTCFFWDGLDDPVAVVREDADAEWLVEDWRDVSDPEAAFQRLIHEDREKAFDLSDAPLFRLSLVRVANERWLWLWTFHHMILDGWSAQLLLDEARLEYRAELEGVIVERSEPFDYSEYLGWLANDDEDDERFWTGYLAGFTEPHALEVPGLPSTRRGLHQTVDYDVDSESVAKLRRLAMQSGVTLNTAVVASWALVLSRWVRSRDVVFGVTTAGRPVELKGVDEAIGLFINTIPLRLQPDPNSTVEDWLKQVQRSELDARDFQLTPLSSILKWSDVPDGHQIFESLFVFENYPPADSAAQHSLRISDVQFLERSNYPLAVLAVPDGENLAIKFVFDPARFSEAAIDSLAGQLRSVIKGFGERPRSELRRIALVDGPSLKWSRRGEKVDETLVLEKFQLIVAEEPGSTAIVSGTHELTYRELDMRATEVASRLRDDGVGPGALVGVMTDHSLDAVIGILGVLKAGGAYVPLDPAYPSEHLDRIVRNAGVHLIVAGRQDAPFLSSSVDVIRVDDQRDHHEFTHVPEPDDLAYVIHTSGSTGGPKGVMVSHANLAYSTNARSIWYGDPVGRFLMLSSFSFDSSVAGIFWTLTTGGALILPPTSGLADADALVKLAERETATHLLALPGLYEIMLERAQDGELGSLDVAIIAGEPGTSALAELHHQTVPSAALHNEYGPTEATVWATAYHVTEVLDAGPLPIGRPIPGTTVAILDEDDNHAPVGFPGELRIDGPGVSHGYLGVNPSGISPFRPATDATGSRAYMTGDIVAAREDGEILFLGRSDSEVKLRGHRIDTGAVASEIRRHADLHDIAVSIARSRHGGSARLVAHVVSTTRDLDVEALKSSMSSALPDFMVPDAIVSMAELPRLPNGKIDSARLPDPLDSKPEPVAPRTRVERALAELWAGLLGIKEIGVEDSWVSLGGDSLLGIRMISRARDLGLGLQPADLAARPTISALAESLEAPDSSRETGQLLLIQPHGEKTPLICLHAAGGNVMPFHVISDALGPKQPVYAFTAVGIDGQEAPLESIPEMASLYLDQLRQVQPSGPYRLLGDCMGGAIGLELANQLQALGESVDTLIIIDGALPAEGSKATTPGQKARQALRTQGAQAVVRGATRMLTRRVTRWVDSRFGGSEGELKAYRDRVAEASARAFATFEPAPGTAPIVLIKSTSEKTGSDGLYWHMSWEQFTPEFHVEFVESDHETITREPAIRDVAAVIGKHLEMANR